MMDFNTKEFLATSLNDGKVYWDYIDNCGCIKGIAAKTCNSLEENRSIEGEPLFPTGTPELSWMNEIRTEYPRFGRALDVAEHILLAGYPQKAKLYITHVIEKYEVLEPHSEGLEAYNSYTDRRVVYKNAKPSKIWPIQYCPEIKKVRDTVKTTLKEKVTV